VKNHKVSTVLVIFINIIIIYKTYQFKYCDFIFDRIIYSVIVVIGLIVWGIVLSKDLKLFRAQEQSKYFTNAIITTLGINWSINNDFNKQTLVKVFYNGDFNGTGIDFKKDGTYIFDNFCLGSNYEYGTYQINGDYIELDRNEIDHVIKSKWLKIVLQTVSCQDEIKEENYVFQIDEFGHKMKEEIEFRVVIDNRKKPSTST